MEGGETITRTVLSLLRCDLLAVPLLDTVMFVTAYFSVVVVVATAVAFNRRGQYRPLMVRERERKRERREKRDGK